MILWVKVFQTELMFEIYSKRLVRAIGKVSLMSFSSNTNKTHQGEGKWPLFVNKQLFWWSISITMGDSKLF